VILAPNPDDVDVFRVVATVTRLGDPLRKEIAAAHDWTYDRTMVACDRAVAEGLVERVRPEHRRDTCPTCGGERFELHVVPERFYCIACRVATVGPNTEPPGPAEPEQIDLFPTNPPLIPVRAVGPPAAEAPPLDEGMAWVGEEGPDE